MPMASVHLGSIETSVARTLSERTDDNGDRLDIECGLALPRSYSYGYGDWYIPSIGNNKALAILNLKLIGQTGTKILKTATIEKIRAFVRPDSLPFKDVSGRGCNY